MLGILGRQALIGLPIVCSFSYCYAKDEIRTDKLKCGAQFIGKDKPPPKSVVLLNCGCFNPPTYMHLRMMEVAASYLKQEGWDVLGSYMSPVHDGYNKPDLQPAEIRRRMCELAVQDSNDIMVDGWESAQDTYQRTLYVLRHIKQSLEEKMPGSDVRVMIVCGGDFLESFCIPGVWKRPHVKEILREYGVACIEREGTHLYKLLECEGTVLNRNKENIRIITDPSAQNNISSSKIRESVRKGFSIKYLVPDSVIEYIQENELYKEE